MIEDRKPVVSIIIPFYNQRKRYLDECLRSVCAQSYESIEVIVVNDGSTDDSPTIANAWSRKDNRVHVEDKVNEGVTMARRYGLTKATGEYVAFVDSDDLLPRQAIEILVHSAEDSGADLVIGSMTKKLGFIKQSHVDKNLSFPFYQLVSQPELFEQYYIGFFLNSVFSVSMCARIYRKSLIDKAMHEAELFDREVGNMGEDQFFNLKLFPYLNSMYRTDETVYIYRFGGGTFGFNKNFPQVFKSSDKRLKLLDQYHYEKGYRSLYAEYVACLYFHASRLITCKITDKDGVKDYFRDEIEHRELMPRLLDYYTEHGAPDKRTQCLLDRDFEGMYACACDINRQRFGSLKGMIRRRIIRLMVRLS